MTQSRSAPLRVGLLGYGYSGKTFHAPLITAVAGLELVAIASSAEGKVHADLPGMRVEADPHAVATSADVDLVVVATPNDTHAPLARAALSAGKHVIVDKPFTLDLNEARNLVALAERQEVLLSVFHNRRWDSDFLTVRQAVAEGQVGTVSHFESHFDRFRPNVRNRWRERAGPGSGVWFDLGPHLVDQALQLFGLPERVQGNFALQREGAMTDDWAHVVLDYEQLRVVLHGSMLVTGGTDRFIVHGSSGSMVKACADRQEQQLIQGMRPGAPGWGEDADALVLFDRDGERRSVPALPGDQRLYYASIVDMLTGASADPATAMQALAVMAVVEAATVSARIHASVELPLTPAERKRWR